MFIGCSTFIYTNNTTMKNTLISTSLEVIRRQKAKGGLADFFSIPNDSENMSELVDHARNCIDAVKDNLKEAKKFENKDAHKMFACRERSCECRAHLHAIERRAETMPIIHEGDSARRKEILAIVKRGVVVGK